MTLLNETHDPALRSWLASANVAHTDFPIQNLPFAVFRRKGEAWRGGVAIGDDIIDLALVTHAGVFSGLAAQAASAGSHNKLNDLMAMGPRAWSALRLAISRAMREGSPQQEALSQCLVSQVDAEYDVPARIGDYTDFYTSIHHATNIGRQFRPDQPLLPITSGCRLATTGAHPASWFRVVTSNAPSDKPCRPTPVRQCLAHANGWISSLKWASSLARVTPKENLSRCVRLRTISLVCAC